MDAVFHRMEPQYKYIKVTGRIIDDQPIEIMGNRSITIYGGSNSRLERSNNGPILHIKENAAVTVYGLEITGQRGTGGADHAIRIEKLTGTPVLTLVRVKVFNNAGRGITGDGGSLALVQSTVSDCNGGGIFMTGGRAELIQSTVSLNLGGGISLSATNFDITNSVIVKNGPGANFGGVKIDNISSTEVGRFEFNTVAQNQGGTAAGVSCTLGVMPTLDFKNSIVYGNGAGLQVEGSNCIWSTSDIGPMGVSGNGNINESPMFVSPALDNFHLTAGSPAKDKAVVTTPPVNVDIDGEPRPQGTAPDMGADEIR